MDSVTQAVLGASIGGAMLGRAHGRKAYAAGAMLATLPDLDVLIGQPDPITAMVAHRGFSHSVFVLSAVAMLLAWLWRRWRPSPVYTGWWLAAALWLILVTHPLLDAFTSYGTQLFWPWRPVPTAWSTIFIIDPFYTLPLLVATVVGLIGGATAGRRRLSGWALALSTAYLASSVGVKGFIEHRVQTQLADDGIAVQAMFSSPEPFSVLLWRVVARTEDDALIEAISGVLDRGPAETLRQPRNAELLRDMPPLPKLDALRWFTGDWLRYDVIDDQLVVTDLRMGLAAGLYSFRFRIAERDGLGQWHAVTPARWPSPRPADALRKVLRRIWQTQPPLPLEEWSRRMTAGAGLEPSLAGPGRR